MSFKKTSVKAPRTFGSFGNLKKDQDKIPQTQKRWDKKKDKYILKDQIYSRLTAMLERGKGRSRYEDKKSKSDFTKDKIYSFKTYHTYREQSYRFANFLKKEYPEVKRIQQVKIEHVNNYLQSMIDEELSAYTISTSKAAIAKVLGKSSTEFMSTPARHRKDIKRSRGEAIRDRHISDETEKKFAKITSAIGLRSSEIKRVRGVDLKEIEGEFYVKVRPGQGKGGKSRLALIVGKDDEETREIIQMFREAGQLKVVPKLPSHYDNHSYRATYAKRVYNLFARPIEEIPAGPIDQGGKRYVLKGELAGEILDRDAMAIASKYLGHSRIDVIAQSYLYN